MNEINRVNFANQLHHRELIRRQIDPSLIDRLQISHNPSLNYKTAFKGVYQDELERTVEEHREKKYADYSLNLPHRNADSLPKHYATLPSHNMANSQSISRLRGFADFEEEKNKKCSTLVEKQLNQGHSFFRAQDQYQQRKHLELQANKRLLLQQLETKELQRRAGAREHLKDNQEVRENRRRQVEAELVLKERSRAMQLELGQEMRGQMEQEQGRRHHKSILQLGQEGRHNPITNPIEYHIDNPYILSKIQGRERRS